MSIDQHNYELFILEYYEGKLDAETTKELMQFLEQNPEAKDAFESYEIIMLEPNLNQQFEPKSSLKKTVVIAVGELNEHNFENYFIESIENNLSTKERTDLEVFQKENPQLQKIFDLYKNIVLQPDKSVIFEGKNILKKKSVIPLRPTPMRRLINSTVSVAAVLAVIIVSGIIIRSINVSNKRGCLSMIRNKGFRHCERYKNTLVKQNTFIDTHDSKSNSLNRKQQENISYANNNLLIRSQEIEKIETNKFIQVVPLNHNELAASVNLSKRKEYTEIINERKILLNRRNKEKDQEENSGLANFMVKEIKNAARTTTKNQDDIKDNKKLGLWDIAGFGVYAYNRITDKRLTLNKKTDASGRLMSFKFEDENQSAVEKK